MIRVIGLGSPFGDDRVGWYLIECLSGRLPAGVEAIALDRPGAGLLDALQGVDRLILFDAVLGASKPGEILCLDPASAQSGAAVLSSHGLDLAQTLELAAALDRWPARIEVFGITIADPLHNASPEAPSGDKTLTGGRLTPAVARAAETLAQRIMAALDEGA